MNGPVIGYWLSEEAQVGAKMGFTAGLAVGLLAGSRAGRGLYDRSAAAATAVVNDPRVRQGATTALHKASDASSNVAGAAARKVTHRMHGDESEDSADAEGGAAGDGRAADGHRHWRSHGHAGHGLRNRSGVHVPDLGNAPGFRALRESIARKKGEPVEPLDPGAREARTGGARAGQRDTGAGPAGTAAASGTTGTTGKPGTEAGKVTYSGMSRGAKPTTSSDGWPAAGGPPTGGPDRSGSS